MEELRESSQEFAMMQRQQQDAMDMMMGAPSLAGEAAFAIEEEEEDIEMMTLYDEGEPSESLIQGPLSALRLCIVK